MDLPRLQKVKIVSYEDQEELARKGFELNKAYIALGQVDLFYIVLVNEKGLVFELDTYRGEFKEVCPDGVL